jgi:hypothetical protein
MVTVNPHYIWVILIGVYFIVIYSSYIQSQPRTNTKSTQESFTGSTDDNTPEQITQMHTHRRNDRNDRNDRNEPEQITHMEKNSLLKDILPADTPNETILPTPFLPKQVYYIEDKLPGDPIGFTILEEQFNSIAPAMLRHSKN